MTQESHVLTLDYMKKNVSTVTQSVFYVICAKFCCVSSYALSTWLFLIPSKEKGRMDYFGISTIKYCTALWKHNKQNTVSLRSSSLASFGCRRCTSSQNKHQFSIYKNTYDTLLWYHSFFTSPPSACYLLTRPSTPDTFNTSPCTHAPLWTACSCRCLPRKPRERKSRFYHHLDCRCLQWGEPL